MTAAFRALLLEGIRKFAEGGYTSEGDLEEWLLRLHTALDRELPTDEESRAMLRRILEGIYARDVRSGLAKRIPGVERFTLDRIQPHLRVELDRRIFAGVDLIRLNRSAAIAKTLQRFAGWVSSVPPAGLAETNLREIATDIGKSVAQLKYERRRVAIDQGHKLSAAVAHVVAQGEGAIAGIWHDRGEKDHGYDARPAHLARSGKIFLVRDSWAMNEGLVRRTADVGFTDDIEQPAEFPYCSCYYEYIVSPHRLPPEALTARGRAWVGGLEVLHDSSSAQLGAGNYRKGHTRWNGLEISIETRAGEIRTGMDKYGQKWEVAMPADYGYIRRTKGADDEQIDCYLGPNSEAPLVWVIQQGNPDSRSFDEQKVMLGFNSREIAIETYVHGFSDGKGRLRVGDVLELPVDEFVAQIRDGRPLLVGV